MSKRKFFEIVNWKKAQPKMKGGGQSWMKLYTSLLYHEAFAGLDYADQMAIVAIWLYAAVSGHHILPADPKWLMQRIPLLKEPPNLELLADVVDTYGNHNPFIKFCDAPKVQKARSKKTRTERERERESKTKEKRPHPTGSGKKERERKKTGSAAKPKQGSRKKKEQKEAEKPENPKESDGRSDLKEFDAGPAADHFMPAPAASVNHNRNRGPQRLGSILGERLPPHWRDADAEAFGWDIVEALGMPRDPQNMNIRSEWGCFAKFWWEIKQRASPMILDELRSKAVAKARFVNSPKAKSARRKGAVWRKIMEGEIAKIGLPRKVGNKQERNRL